MNSGEESAPEMQLYSAQLRAALANWLYLEQSMFDRANVGVEAK